MLNVITRCWCQLIYNFFKIYRTVANCFRIHKVFLISTRFDQKNFVDFVDVKNIWNFSEDLVAFTTRNTITKFQTTTFFMNTYVISKSTHAGHSLCKVFTQIAIHNFQTICILNSILFIQGRKNFKSRGLKNFIKNRSNRFLARLSKKCHRYVREQLPFII